MIALGHLVRIRLRWLLFIEHKRIEHVSFEFTFDLLCLENLIVRVRNTAMSILVNKKRPKLGASVHKTAFCGRVQNVFMQCLRHIIVKPFIEVKKCFTAIFNSVLNEVNPHHLADVVVLKHLDDVLLARLRINNRNVKGKNGHCALSCLVFDYRDLIFLMD